MSDWPPRLILVENDDKGGVRSRPETVDAVAAVVQAWRAMSPSRRCLVGENSPGLWHELHTLDERWPR